VQGYCGTIVGSLVVDITSNFDKLGHLAKYVQRIWHGVQGGDICNDAALCEVDGEEVRGSCGFEMDNEEGDDAGGSCTPLMDYRVMRSGLQCADQNCY